VLARPFEVRDGLLHPPAVAGNGLERDEAAVARYQEHS
jgi:L-alanine-DL-glutamate epimerase-like enolase superfamily enzyme